MKSKKSTKPTVADIKERKKALAAALATAKAKAALRVKEGVRTKDIPAKAKRIVMEEEVYLAIRRKLKGVLDHFRSQNLLGFNNDWTADIDWSTDEEVDDSTMTTITTDFAYLSFTDKNTNEIYIEATGLKNMRVIYPGHRSTSKYPVRSTKEELAADFIEAKKQVRTFTHWD